MTRFADLEKITEFPDDAEIVVQPDGRVPPVRMDLDLVVPPAGTFTAEDEEKLDGIEDEATADQTGAEIADLLNALEGDERVDVAAVKGAATSAVTSAQYHQGIPEIPGSDDNSVQDNLRNAEVVSDLIREGVKYYVPGGDAGGLKGKVVRRTGTALPGGTSAAAFRASFSTYWETILDDGGVSEATVDSKIDTARHNLSLKDVRNISRNTDGTLDIELNDGTLLKTGKDLKAVRDQGAYSGAITYGERDLVSHNGGWYLANRTGFSGIEPRVTANWTNWWDFLCWENGAPGSIVDWDFDAETGEAVTRTRGGTENRKAVPTGGTVVAANPAGTDGDPLTRIAVGGTNYYVPQGYAWYARPTLTVPASITSDTNVPVAGRVFDLLDAETIQGGMLAGVDFTTEWFGCFEINIAAPGSGDAKARSLRATLITTHAFNGKSIVHERTADIGITENQFLCVDMHRFNSVSRVSLGAYRPPDGNADGSDDVEITAADLAGTVDISYQVRLQGIGRTGAGAAFTIEDLIWMQPVTRSYQIVHGEGGALPGPTPPAVRPSISSYTLLSGDQNPVAGSIAANRYGLAWQIAQPDHVGSARILGFKGAYGDGTGATVVQNIDRGASPEGHPNIGWASGQAEVNIPNGVALAADETYTLRLQVFREGVTNPSLTTDPAAYQDIVITAHAAATATVHWGRIAKMDGRSVADTVAAIDFATDDTATGTALATAYTAVLPNDGSEYQVYLAVAASLDQPSGFTLGGQPYAGFEPAEDKTASSTAYKVHLQSAAVALTNAEGDGLRYGVTA